MILLRLVSMICFALLCNGEQTIQVDTDLGKIKGLQMTSRLGKNFWAFRGIRYAKAPIGELRFQSPQPIEVWKPQIYDATTDGPICPQAHSDINIISEDCLRLNIYTRDLNSLRPVLVFLHPGGFYSGSGRSDFAAGPQNLMDRDIVLVTLNYRLGSLGFLATGTSDAIGNMGLKDQVTALRWIQKHIGKFGGDSNSVTLWGYSAGSFSTGLHMMSSMSKGLFQRAIMMSSAPLGQFNFKDNQLELAQKQAQLLKCPDKPIKDMVACLKTKSTNDFVNTVREMFEYAGKPIYNWLPVIEPDFGQDRFIAEDPYKIMERGAINKVPLIIGITEYEFYYVAYYILRDAAERELFNEDFEKLAPIHLLYERNTERSRQISKMLREKYLNNQPLAFPESVEKFGELYSDGVIGYSYHRFLDMVIKHVPVFTYLTTYKGRYSHFTNPTSNQTKGAMHHDELFYLFYVPIRTPLFSETDHENEIIERLTRMWSEFAKKGNPNDSKDAHLKNIQWPIYTDTKKEYLEIGDNLIKKSGGVFIDRFQLWDSLFPLK
uniref:Carboxylic ester hydrolase n=1 Tax=Glossina brevipalpis TaxID=37001 RepID=A0A1A9WY03_9MUSC